MPNSEITTAAAIDAAHLTRQPSFSERTFGPGLRTKGVIDHIRKELLEIEADPTDLGEWVDVIILAFDGAWRAGHGPQQIIDAIVAKQSRNEARVWPDWRTADPDKAIEHDRTADAPTDQARCVWCHRPGHTADEHPLPKGHPQYDAFYDASDDELAGMVSTAVWPNGHGQGEVR